MRGTLSEDHRVYRYESPLLHQDELHLSELRGMFVRALTNDPHAKYVSSGYGLDKKKRTVLVWRTDGKILSATELTQIDRILPGIFDHLID